MSRIVFTSFGSFGDLHPYLAIAQKLQARGIPVLVASCPNYKDKVLSHGFEFVSMRPNEPQWSTDTVLAKDLLDEKKSAESLVRRVIMADIENSYVDLFAATKPNDLLISHPLTLVTRLVADVNRQPWISTMLQPMGFFSRYDPPVMAPAPILTKIGHVSPLAFAGALKFLKMTTHPWSKPYRDLRHRLGLPSQRDPLFSGQHSPHGVLALFSKHFAEPQSDWPAKTTTTGFPFLNEHLEPSPSLQEFVTSGDAPLVFTLGSAAIHDAGSFYGESIKVCKTLGRRGILLAGKEYGQRYQHDDKDILVTDYAPFTYVFPHASAIIHSGGIGTLAQALTAGKPSLVVPFANDQPDNAARIERLGVGLEQNRHTYSAGTVAPKIARLLTDKTFERNTVAMQKKLAQENGAETAADYLEQKWRSLNASGQRLMEGVT